MTLPCCIYCRRIDVPRTREHVLQAAFGAVATLPSEVCGECNSAFSPIDKAFIDAVNFYHVGGKVLRQLGFGRVTLDDGTNVVARYRPDGMAEFPPQLYETGNGEWRFLGNPEGDFERMMAELATVGSNQVKSEVIQPTAGVPRRAIIRSAPRVYLVQGTDAKAVEVLVNELNVRGLTVDWTREGGRVAATRDPSIKFDTSLHLMPFCRAMAKVALNFVCYRLGAGIALRSEFDSIRRFARYGEGHFIDYAVPTALNHTLGDSVAPFATPDHHVLYLATGNVEGGRREAVFIAIKGKTVGRLDLTRGRPGLEERTTLLTRFDATLGTIEDLTLPADMLRAVLNPAVLGLADVWPPRELTE